MKRILLIEDDENLSRGLVFTFEREGFEVRHSSTLGEGREYLKHGFDLMILDLNLPDGDGLAFCKEVRQTSNIPILMLTARDLEMDEVSGLMAGADDYLTKPFSLSVLRARVESIFRRLAPQNQGWIEIGDCRLDTMGCKLYRKNEEILLSSTEYQLLRYLMTHAGQVLSKQQILEAVWDAQGAFVDENTLTVNISRLRAKIEDNPKSPDIIKNVRGLGYQFLASK